jgi:K+-sensing histidine kinase KdpD
MGNGCVVFKKGILQICTKTVRDFMLGIIQNEYDICFENNFLRGLRVLIVDDDRQNIYLLTEVLSVMQLEIFTFTNPKEVIKITEHEKFDLFLLDIKMPAMSGFELAQKIQTSRFNKNAPIMFISALCDPDNKIRSYNMGSHAYIEKPFHADILRSQIFNILKVKILQDELNSRKETYLAMITHDLKTPVSAEICALEFLLNNNSLTDSSQREVMDDMLGAAKYMKTLVDNTLIKYKFENDLLVLHKNDYSLEALVTECLEEVKYLFVQKNQTPKFCCALKNSRALMDYTEIKRVIHNLIINACEHGSKNSNIDIELHSGRRNFVFNIKNYGSYIENPEEMFAKGYSSAQKRVGTGLGLYIARRIIEAHGGKINAKSKNNNVIITFTLPNAA